MGLYVRTHYRGASLLTLLAYLAAAAPAGAQEQAPRCDEDPVCSPLAQRAGESSDAGRLEDAVAQYRAAYVACPDPRLLYNTARLLQRLGRPLEAVEPYQRFLQSNTTDETLRTKAQEALEQIRNMPPVAPAVPPPTTAPVATAACVPEKPAYKKGWFWAVVGGLGAVAVAGVVVSVVLAARHTSSMVQGPTFTPF